MLTCIINLYDKLIFITTVKPFNFLILKIVEELPNNCSDDFLPFSETSWFFAHDYSALFLLLLFNKQIHICTTNVFMIMMSSFRCML